MARLLNVLVALMFVAGAAAVHAQSKRPRAEVTPSVVSAPVRAGSTVRLALRVKLPGEVHVQSDKPRDSSLIPTVLTIEAPAGVTVEQTTYPPPEDLVQPGQRLPLAVFGPEFTIEVRLALATTVPAGTLGLPARLRYQACDSSMCYPPARADVRWTIVVEGQ